MKMGMETIDITNETIEQTPEEDKIWKLFIEDNKAIVPQLIGGLTTKHMDMFFAGYRLGKKEAQKILFE
jgi:hypothetical protein